MVAEINFGFGAPSVPLIYQATAAECGLACLAMIASRHGAKYDLRSLRLKFPEFLRGARLPQLIDCAEKMSMVARPLRLESSELPMLKLPCILHWNLNHFVVLVAVKGRTVKIHDPSTGRCTLDFHELSKHFTGVALELSPALEFEPVDDTKVIKLSAVLGKVVGWKSSVFFIFSIAFVLEILSLAGPLCNQWVVDEVISSGNLGLLNVLILGSALMLVTQVGLGVARTWTILYVSTNLNMQWSMNVFSHLLRLPLNWFERRHLGDIVSRVGSVQTIQRTLTTGFVEASLDGIFGLVTLGMMLLYNKQLSIVVVVSVACYVALRTLSFRAIKEASEAGLNLSAKESSFFLESIRGIQAIKLFGKEMDRRCRWLSLVVDVTNRELQTEKLVLGLGLISSAISGAQLLLIFWLGANLVIGGDLTIGALFAFGAYGSAFSSRVVSLVDQVAEFRMLALHSSRLADIVLETPENRPAGQQYEEKSNSQIEFVNVSFRFDDISPWLLYKANLVIEPGEAVAFVGPSGCGKTTLIKLILGILLPTEGEVRFGGVPVQRLSASAYKAAFGSVMQDDQLFSGSIADNICFFDAVPDFPRIVKCAELASVHHDISRFAMGYQTAIGDMGSTLSGGQKQRILLARALYKEPQVLVLDEATSHLDIAKEKEVNGFVKTLSISRVSVAHRPETIAMADRIVQIIDGGHISETRSDKYLGRG